ALMFLGQPAMIGWNTSVRSDMPCLLLMLVCLRMSLQIADRPAAASLGSGALAGIAFLFKQTAAAAPAAIFWVLLRAHRRQQAGLFALATASVVALGLGVVYARESYFLEQFTTAGKGPWSLSDAAGFLAHRLSDITWLFPLAIGALGIPAALRT